MPSIVPVIPTYENVGTANSALRGRRVSVYWNARKGLYSVLDRRTRRVIAHTKALVVTYPTFRVMKKRGATDPKDDRGMITGLIEEPSTCTNAFKVQYIPYLHESYMYYNGNQFKPIRSAGKAELAINNNAPFVNVDEVRVSA